VAQRISGRLSKSNFDPRMRKDFRKNEKIQCLIWCDRHCCLCEKPCGLDIEMAHIGNREDDNIDNGIPVCYDCHAKMGMYNELHPRGTKLSQEEVKARREQIYDKYTRQYITPIHYVISQNGQRRYPDVGLSVVNLSDYLVTQLTINLQGYLNGKRSNLRLTDPLYRGEKVWNVNSRRQINGHFEVRNPRLRKLKMNDRLEIRVSIVQRDAVGRDHRLLEDGYVYNTSCGDWYFEP